MKQGTKKRFKTMTLLIFLVCFVSGCGTYSRNKLINDCYTPYAVKTSNYIQSEHQFITLWENHSSSRDHLFFKLKGLKGYLVHGRVAGGGKATKIGQDDKVSSIFFNGQLYETYPDWLERNIGGSRASMYPIVEVSGDNYVFLIAESKAQWKETLSSKCYKRVN